MAWLGLARATATGRRVRLAARPRGVLHLCESPIGRAGKSSPRPVCGQRCRRLYVHGGPQPGVPEQDRVVPVRPLCRRCSARIQAWAGPVRAEQLSHTMTGEEADAAAAAIATPGDYWDALTWMLTCTPRVLWVGAFADARLRVRVGDDTEPRVFARTVRRLEPGAPSPWATRPVDEAARARAVLAFERQVWRHHCAKESVARELFGLSPTRYYQVLGAALDTPEAIALDPVLVNRLRRARAAGRRARTASAS